eukprot:342115-Chlamydomonas_euryale.AAC.1
MQGPVYGPHLPPQPVPQQAVPTLSVVPVEISKFTEKTDPTAWLNQAELAADAARAQTGQRWDRATSYLTEIVASKLLPSKVNWYKGLVQLHGPLSWDQFRTEFLKEHLKVVPEW